MNFVKHLLCLVLVGAPMGILGEQSAEFDDWTIHYSVIPSTFLSKEVAEKHNIVRGKNRALCNITVIDPQGNPQESTVTGSFKNLLGQDVKLKFKTVTEAKAVYSIASFKFSEGEKLKFKITVELPDGDETVEFEQEIHSPDEIDPEVSD